MQRFWFLCVAMMVLGGCMADTRGLHMDGGNDDIVEPMDGGNDDIVEPMDGGNDEAAFAVAVCIQLNLEIWCGSYPNSDFQNLEELRQICEYTVTREAAPNCIAEFISLYECGTELFSDLPICQPNQPRGYPWVEPCGGNALALCQSAAG